jgi:mTERF domain-containing protein
MIRCSSIHLMLLCTLYIISYASAFTVCSRSCVRRCRLALLSSHLHSEEDVQIYPINTLDSSPSLVPDIAYYYLQKTIGLSEETMWKITLDASSALGMTPRNLEKKISLLRRTMDLSDKDVREIIDKQPAILHLSADRNLSPTILLLVRALDLSKSELRSIIMACPSILGYSSENLKSKLAFFTNTLGYNTGDRDDGIEKVRNLFLKEPKLLLCGVKSGLIPRMKFLHKEIKFPLKDLRILYQKSPKLLLYSLDNNLREKIVFFFILQLQMELGHVRKLLMTYPQVMDYNLENHMKPITEYFVTELEFSAIELRSIILRFPRVFTHSLFKVKHVIGFLRYELALDAQQVKRVVFQAPQIIGLDTEGNLKEKLDFLQQRIGLTQEELAMFIAKMPTIFNLNIETSLIPKFEYLEMNMNCTDVLKEALLKQPVLLGYSLNRTQTRMEELVAAGISPNKITVGISMTDARFHQWVLSLQTRLETSRWNSTVVTYLCNSVEFTNEDVESLLARVSNLPTSVMQMRSQLSYLKQVCGTEDIKSLILEYPQLVDRFSKSEIRRRVNALNMLELPLRDNIESLVCDTEEFNKWIEPMVQNARSDISFITERLELNETEARVLLSHFPEIESTTNWKSVRLKLNLLLTEWDSEKVKTLLLSNPEIIGSSFLRLKHRVQEIGQHIDAFSIATIGRLLQVSAYEFPGWLQRIKLMMDHGRPPSEINSIIYKSPAAAEEYVARLYLSKRLGVKDHEADMLLGVIAAKRQILAETMQKVEYLLSKAFRNSTDDLKQALLVHPGLLQKSLNNTMVPKVQTLQCLRSVGLEYTPIEVGRLLLNVPAKCEHIPQKLEYLLNHVFDHTTEDLKETILAYPALLQQSMDDTFVQKVNTLQYLRSVGFEYAPEEIGELLSSTSSKYEHFLVPTVKTWSPDKERRFNGVEDAIRASLHEYSPSLMIACSQDYNREMAHIVHWK